MKRLAQGINDLWMRMPENQRSPRANVVNQAISVRVDQMRARGRFDEAGCATDAAERSHGAIYTTGDQFLGAIKKLFRDLF